MKILVVEDDRKISAFIAKGLEGEGYQVSQAGDGQAGLDLALKHSYDGAVVDVMLPRKDGLKLVEELRGKGQTMPVIFLSAKRSVDDRIKGLQKGGDDYLTKPFALPELAARLQAVLRRSQPHTPTSRLVLGDLTLDPQAHEAARQGRKLDLHPREFSLLEYLMRRSPQMATKTMILEQIWGYDFDPQTNVVDVLVCRLRNKLDKDFEPKRLQTLRGVGYVLK
jgi:two-component system OmpR family response regulator